MSKISHTHSSGQAKEISGHELWLLYLPKTQIDRELSGTVSQHVKGLQAILDNLTAQPLISSRLPGIWHTLGVRKLTQEQAQQEVGYLYKNTTQDQRQALKNLKATDISCDIWRDRRYVAHVNETRRKLGLDRTCRMQADYQPLNELHLSK